MFIAVNDKKEKVHISKAVKGNNYYCPICNNRVIMRTGSTNQHHFSHQKQAICIDSWTYDITEWHYLWQQQFPIETQEIIFENNNEIHRADVFINNTVIEFQHSPISKQEFNGRNKFYNKLGYKVIWIFDVQDKNIEYLGEGYDDIYRAFCWRHAIKFLKTADKLKDKITVFLQIENNIWNNQENYKSVNNFAELKIKPNLIKIDKISNEGLKKFYSKDYYSDYEMLDFFLKLNLKREKNYDYKIKTNNKILYDPLYTAFPLCCGYCSKKERFIDYGEHCKICPNYVEEKRGCDYRFKKLLTEDIYINRIEKEKGERIKKIDFTSKDKRIICTFDDTPNFIGNIKQFVDINKNMTLAVFRNVKSELEIQMNENNINIFLNTNKCYGKLYESHVELSEKEYEIKSHNDLDWILLWYKSND